MDDDVDIIDDDDLLDEEDLKKPDPASLRGDYCVCSLKVLHEGLKLVNSRYLVMKYNIGCTMSP